MSLTYPNPNLLFTYATAVLAQPHTRSRTTEPGPFASQSQPYTSQSGRCRRADGAAAARAGGPRTAQRPLEAAARRSRPSPTAVVRAQVCVACVERDRRRRRPTGWPRGRVPLPRECCACVLISAARDWRRGEPREAPRRLRAGRGRPSGAPRSCRSEPRRQGPTLGSLMGPYMCTLAYHPYMEKYEVCRDCISRWLHNGEVSRYHCAL